MVDAHIICWQLALHPASQHATATTMQLTIVSGCNAMSVHHQKPHVRGGMSMVSRQCTLKNTMPTVVVPAPQGTTTMLLVNIPHFRELLIASFECPECGFRCVIRKAATAAPPCGSPVGGGASVHLRVYLYPSACSSGPLTSGPFACVYRNSEVQFAGAFGEQGVHHTLKVRSSLQTRNRQCPAHNTCSLTDAPLHTCRASGDLIQSATQVAKRRTDLLRRQVVKSNSATVTVPELQFEIPPGTQKGVITTVEGLLTDASTGLRSVPDPFDRRPAFTASLCAPEHKL